MNTQLSSDLSAQVIGCAMVVHRTLGSGYHESVYQNALCLELAEAGIHFETHKKLCVFYKGRPVGDFEADVIVADSLLLELKAVENLNKAHEAQVVNYLTTTGIEHGLLLNFGSSSLQFKKKFRVYRASEPPLLQS